MGRDCLLILLCLCLGTPVSCSTGLKVKVYYSSPSDGGIVRKQDHQVIPYEHTEGFRCLDSSDWEAVLNYIRSCQIK